MMLLNTPAFKCDECDLALQHIQVLQDGMARNPRSVVTNMLATLNSEQLKIVNQNLDNNNFIFKTETLAKAVFSHDFDVATHKKNAMKKMEEALQTVTRIAFTAQFYNGSFDWDKYKEEVYEAVKRQAQAEVAPRQPNMGGLGN